MDVRTSREPNRPLIIHAIATSGNSRPAYQITNLLSGIQSLQSAKSSYLWLCVGDRSETTHLERRHDCYSPQGLRIPGFVRAILRAADVGFQRPFGRVGFVSSPHRAEISWRIVVSVGIALRRARAVEWSSETLMAPLHASTSNHFRKRLLSIDGVQYNSCNLHHGGGRRRRRRDPSPTGCCGPLSWPPTSMMTTLSVSCRTHVGASRSAPKRRGPSRSLRPPRIHACPLR